jgi:hypothetical protein
MTSKNSLLIAGIAIAMIVGSGYVQGVWTFRWSEARELHAASEKLAKVPLILNDWTGKDTPLDSRQATLGRIHASVSRQYVNAKTGQSVTVLLLCGRPGPLSVHTPEVCYAGSGYEVAGNRSKVVVDYPGGGPGEFWAIKVSKPDPVRPERLGIDYGWFARNHWAAPDMDARFAFSGQAVLYKMYVIHEQDRSDESGTVDASSQFLKDFLPTLQEILAVPA